MRFLLTQVLAAVVVLATATAVPAMEKELAEYNAVALHVCDRDSGVTPELQAKYDALVASVDKARYGYGRTASPSNFWGPTSPRQLIERCHQSGGDGGAGAGAGD